MPLEPFDVWVEKHPFADQRIDPTRLSPLARQHYDRVDWGDPTIQPTARMQWDYTAKWICVGLPAHKVSRWLEDCWGKGRFGPDHPYTLQAKAFVRGIVSQVVSVNVGRLCPTED